MSAPMMISELRGHLDMRNACDPALEWIDSLDASRASDAWDACDRVDWLLWLVEECGGYAAFLTVFARECASHCIPIAEKWLEENAPKHAGAPTMALERPNDRRVRAWARFVRDTCAGPFCQGSFGERAPGIYAMCAVMHASEGCASHASYWEERAQPGERALRERQLACIRAAVSWDDIERALRGES